MTPLQNPHSYYYYYNYYHDYYYNYYSKETCWILAAMIITGAIRIVSVKLYYQLHCCFHSSPLILTLLYLLGQALSTVVYCYQQRRKERGESTIMDNVKGFTKVPMQDQEPQQVHGALAVGAEDGLRMATVSSSVSDNDDENNNNNNNNNNNDEMAMELTQLHHREPFGLPLQATTLSSTRDTIASLTSSTPSSNDHETMDKKMNNDAIDTRPKNSSPDTIHDKITPARLPRRRQQRRGSRTGLTAASHQAVAWWVDAIPWYMKPIIPALLNLVNATLRLASLVYMAASVAEVLIAGCELTLSVLAARYIRQRQVSRHRWMGVGVVTIGLVLVGLVDVYYAANRSSNSSSSSRTDDSVMSMQNNMTDKQTIDATRLYDEKQQHIQQPTDVTVATTLPSEVKGQWIGIILIIGQCITSVLQDITEEIFMAESDFPPTLLLGMEGMIGFTIGAVAFIPMARALGEENPWHLLLEHTSWSNGVFALYMIIIFTVTGIANISATAATSSMTRNVWKNVRTLLVWALGLAIHVLALAAWPSNNAALDLGESWSMPSSLTVPVASVIMLVGIRLYYWTNEESNPGLQ